MHKHSSVVARPSTKLYGFVGISRFASSISFLDFFKIKQGRIQGGDRRGLEPPPLPHTQKKHISSINEEEKEEEEEREGGRSCYASSIPNGNKLVTVSSFYSLDLQLYIGLLGSLGYFFIPPPFSSKIVQRDPNRGAISELFANSPP